MATKNLVGDRAVRLSEREKQRMFEAFDSLVRAIPPRPLRDVERELAELRRARGAAGRRAGVGRG